MTSRKKELRNECAGRQAAQEEAVGYTRLLDTRSQCESTRWRDYAFVDLLNNTATPTSPPLSLSVPLHTTNIPVCCTR